MSSYISKRTPRLQAIGNFSRHTILAIPHRPDGGLLCHRFDWSGAIKSETKRKPTFARLRTAIRFERVLAARTTGVDLGNKSAVLSLLAVTCEETSPPAGDLTLLFAGGAAIKLHVECIEAEMRDLGAAWQTKAKPDHERDDEGKGG